MSYFVFLVSYTEAKERNIKGGGDGSVRGFPHSAYRYIPLQLPLAHDIQPKYSVDCEDYATNRTTGGDVDKEEGRRNSSREMWRWSIHSTSFCGRSIALANKEMFKSITSISAKEIESFEM
jgi:hypothetical protein